MESLLTPSAQEEGGSRPDPKEASPGRTAKTQLRGWRPASLSIPSLLCILVLSLIFLVGIEVLAQRSAAQNGLALAKSADDIAQSALIASRYLPTLLVTLFGLIWSWVDLDVKRMQPWVELSKSGGESAKNTVLLDYPSMFIVIAPYKALKKRHWTVFVSATVVLAILFVLTPIQGAIFGVAQTAQNRTVSISSRSQLLPVSEQRLSKGYFHEAYGIGWLNMSQPAFTASDYGLLPFSVDDDIVPSGVSRNWSAETTKFWAEFNCSAAAVEVKNRTSGLWAFSGPGGCKYESTLHNVGDERPTLGYVDNSPRSDSNDQDYNCTASSEDYYSAMLYWGQRKALTSSKKTTLEQQYNITALFCDLAYYKQQVLATVTVPDLLPIDSEIIALSEPTKVSRNEFDWSQYVSRDTRIDDLGTWNYTDDQNDSAAVRVLSLNVTLSEHATYLVDGSSGHNFDAYSSASRLERLGSNMHKRLFPLAMLQLTNDADSLASDKGSATFHLSGVLVSRPFAAIAEAILALIALGTLWILYATRSYHCVLSTIPSSIGNLLDLAHDSPEVAKLLWPTDTADDKILAKYLEHRKFQLIVNDSSKQELICLNDTSDSTEELNEMVARGYYVPIKPWILRKPTGSVLALFLVGCLVGLAYLKSAEQKYNGLNLRSKDFFVRQLLESYLPTAIIAMIKPVWILLTRTMCVFQPFLDLWAGKAAASKSIDATYASMPSHAVLFKAFTKGHILLGLLCLITLLANLLAIGISSLFNEGSVMVTQSQNLQPLYAEKFNNSAITAAKAKLQLVSSDAIDHLWITWANMTHDAELPAWLSTDYYFMPHSTGGLSNMAADETLTLPARGFGVNTNCTAGSTDDLPHKISIDDFTDGLTKAQEKSELSTCGDYSVLTQQFMISLYSEQDGVTGPATVQLYVPYLDDTPDGDCEPPFIVGWGKSHSLKANATFNSTYVVCRPTFQTAMFNVTVDKEGHVLGHKRTSNLESELGYANSYNDTRMLLQMTGDSLVSAKSTLAQSAYGSWLSKTLSTGWMSQLTYLQTGNTDSGDPDRPVPDSKDMAPVIDKIFARVFAAYLSTSTDFFQTNNSSASTAGLSESEQTRVFMDKTALIICICVLSLDLLVALLFYIRTIHHTLPREPSTIASTLAHLAPSRAVRDGVPEGGWKTQTFSFGRYMGYDGTSHVGVEIDPYVSGRDETLEKKRTY